MPLRLRRLGLFVLTLLLLLAAYLLLWPVPVQPAAWSAPPIPGYSGPHAVNQGLAGLQHLPLGNEEGPEHVVVRDGWVYAAVFSGQIIRMRADGAQQAVVARTGGRPLGFDFDAEGRMVVADPMWGAHGGLLRVSGLGPQARIELLTDQVDGDPIRYADGVVVAPSGKIYFTDASRRFGARAHGGTFQASVLDILEHQPSGRLLEYDPATRITRVLLGELSFANGLALSRDGQHVFVNETGEYRIWKVSVAAQGLSAKHIGAQHIAAQHANAAPTDASVGAPAGQLAASANVPARILLDNLPGFPDNLMRGQNGRLWVGLVKPRGAFTDTHAGRPWLRAMALRLPRRLWPVPPAYGHVFAFDESGRVLIDLQDPSGSYPEATAITETDDRLYVQSLHATTLGWLDKRAAGL